MKKIIQSKKLHYIIAAAAVAFGLYAYFFAPTTGEAVSISTIGTVKGVLVPKPGSLGTESVAISYTSVTPGVGSLDVSGWTITNDDGFSYTIDSLVLKDGGSFKVCADKALSVCDAEWEGGPQWSDDAGTFALNDNTEGTIFSMTYDAAISGGGNIIATRELTKPVYAKNDKLLLCHMDNKGVYTSKTAQAGQFVRSELDGKPGHHQDPDDIIPAFYYNMGDGLSYYAGLNWPDMKKTFDAGCQ